MKIINLQFTVTVNKTWLFSHGGAGTTHPLLLLTKQAVVMLHFGNGKKPKPTHIQKKPDCVCSQFSLCITKA